MLLQRLEDDVTRLVHLITTVIITTLIVFNYPTSYGLQQQTNFIFLIHLDATATIQHRSILRSP